MERRHSAGVIALVTIGLLLLSSGACGNRIGATAADVEQAARDTIDCYRRTGSVSAAEVEFQFDREFGDAGFNRPVADDRTEHAWDDCYRRLFEPQIQRYRELPDVQARIRARDAAYWRQKIDCMRRHGHELPATAADHPDAELAEALNRSAPDDWYQCGIDLDRSGQPGRSTEAPAVSESPSMATTSTPGPGGK